MNCKNCGREIDSDARFCPVCGFDQTRGSTAYGHVDPAPVRDSASVQEAKSGAMKLTLILSLVVSLILGLWGGVVVLVIMIIYYAVMKKEDSDVVMGSIIGGVIGVVVGYIINLLLVTVLLASLV